MLGGLTGGALDLGALPGAGQAASPTPAPTPTRVEEEGIGDVSLALSVSPFRSERGGGLSFTGGVRLPTGDEDKSLGAGQAIGSLGANYALPVSRSVYLGAGLGYTHAFETEEGGVYGGLGVQVDTASRVSFGASLDWAEATADGFEDATTLGVNAGFQVAERVRLVGYAGAGLTDTSPDTNAGVRLVLRP